MIVGAQRGSSKVLDSLETKDDTGELSDVLLWRVVCKQVETLRAEMEDAQRSVEEAAKNSNIVIVNGA